MVLAEEHGGNLWLKAQQLGLKFEELLDFSANINPLGPPAEVYQEIAAGLKRITHYPTPQGAELINLLSKISRLPEENLLLGNGAGELIYLILQSVRPKRVVLPVPTFSEYARAARAVGADVLEVPLSHEHGFEPNWNRFNNLLGTLDSSDLVFICNPNNPTSHIWSPSFLHSLTKAAEKQGFYLCLDESFLSFLDGETDVSLLHQVEHNKQLVVIRSLTKFYAIPGLRLGFLAADGALVRQLNRLRDPWSVNTLAQIAGLACLTACEYEEKTRTIVAKERDYLYTALKGFSEVRVFPPQANFILSKLSGTWHADSLKSELEGYGILIRDCSNFSGLDRSFFRVAVRLRSENDQLLKSLSRIFQTA